MKKLTVDADNDAEETNEDNNVFAMSFMWSCDEPALECREDMDCDDEVFCNRRRGDFQGRCEETD